MKIPLERLSRNNIRERANLFLNEYYPEKEIPIPIDTIVEKNFKINIVPLPGLRESLDNDGFMSSDFTTIHIDQHIYLNVETRYRFSIAHETGHFWLHKNIFRNLEFHDIESWKRVYREIDDDDYGWLEFQAYTFAAFVLIPDFALEKPFIEALDNIRSDINEIKKNHSLNDMYLDYAINNFSVKLAPKFNASAECMIKRIAKDERYRSQIP